MANSTGESKNKAVKIVGLEFCDGTIKSRFYPEVLEDILRQKSCPDGYLVISVNGPIRTGKSFLINILACYLRQLWKDPEHSAEKWLHSEIKIEGVEWIEGNESVTSGIWVWNELFVVQKDNKKFGVLLMECQGLNDADDTQAEVTDTLITLFALELSNIHIVNVSGKFGSNDLRNLETTIEFGGIRWNRQTETHLKDLVILHRNWELDDDLGPRPSMFWDDLESLTPGRQKIKEAFSGHMEYMLPMPGKTIRKGSSRDGVWIHELMRDEENKVFLEITTDFCQQLVRKLPHGQLKLVEGSQLLENFARLRNCYSDGKNNPRSSSVEENGIYSSVREVVKELKQEIRQTGIPITGYENEEEIEIQASEKETIYTDILISRLDALGYGPQSALLPDLLNNIKRELLETVQEEKQKAKRELEKQERERETVEKKVQEREEERKVTERRENIKTAALLVSAGVLAAGGAIAVGVLSVGGGPVAIAATETIGATSLGAAVTGAAVTSAATTRIAAAVSSKVATLVRAASSVVLILAGAAATAVVSLGTAAVTCPVAAGTAVAAGGTALTGIVVGDGVAATGTADVTCPVSTTGTAATCTVATGTAVAAGGTAPTGIVVGDGAAATTGTAVATGVVGVVGVVGVASSAIATGAAATGAIATEATVADVAASSVVDTGADAVAAATAETAAATAGLASAAAGGDATGTSAATVGAPIVAGTAMVLGDFEDRKNQE